MPYAPGIQYRGDEYLFRGITQGAAGLAEGLTKFAEARKEAKAIDTAFNSTETLIKHMVDSGTLPTDFLAKYQNVATGTTAQKKAALEGFGVAVKYADQAATADYRKKTLALQQAQQERLAASDTREAAQEKAMQGFGQRLSAYMTPTTQPAMTVPGVSGYAGRAAPGLAGPVRLPATTTQPELTPEVLMRLGQGVSPERMAPLLSAVGRFSGGMTEYQQTQADLARKRIDQTDERIKMERQRMSTQAAGYSDKDLVKHIDRLKAQLNTSAFIDDEQKARIKAEMDAYRQAAAERGLSVIEGTAPGADEGLPPEPAAPAAAGVVTTKAQYDALPSGMIYQGKDGKKYRKP